MRELVVLCDHQLEKIEGGLLFTAIGLYCGLKAGAAMAVKVGSAYKGVKAGAAAIAGMTTGGAAGATVGIHADRKLIDRIWP